MQSDLPVVRGWSVSTANSVLSGGVAQRLLWKIGLFLSRVGASSFVAATRVWGGTTLEREADPHFQTSWKLARKIFC